MHLSQRNAWTRCVTSTGGGGGCVAEIATRRAHTINNPSTCTARPGVSLSQRETTCNHDNTAATPRKLAQSFATHLAASETLRADALRGTPAISATIGPRAWEAVWDIAPSGAVRRASGATRKQLNVDDNRARQSGCHLVALARKQKQCSRLLLRNMLGYSE